MRKFLIIFLIICFGFGIAYAAPRTSPRKKIVVSKIKEECDPQKDPNCQKDDQQKNTDKGCRGGKALRVAGMIGNAPFGWVEADGATYQNLQSFGLGRVVLEKMAGELGLRFTSTGYLSQEEILRALKRGEIDLLLATYRHGNFGNEVEVITPAYFKNYFTVYFKKGNELPIESYQDLVGLKGVVRKEELIYPMIYQRLPKGIQLKEVMSASKAFEMLMNDEVDYILGSPYAIEGELRRYKMQNDIVSDGVVLDSATLFFAISKNSPCYFLKDDISNAIREHGFSQKTLDKDVRQLINDWGNRFRSDEALIKTQNNTLPEDLKEKDSEKLDK